jgi:hypothetical protein
MHDQQKTAAEADKFHSKGVIDLDSAKTRRFAGMRSSP